MAWQDVTRKKREQIAALIPPEWRFSSQAIPSRITQPNIVHMVPLFLSPFEEEITSLPVPKLLQALHCGRFTAREVVAAYCHRAALAHQLVSLSL